MYPPPNCEPLAQLAEHRTFNPGVPGSTPGRLTIFYGPIVQWPRTSPFQGGDTSSNLVGTAKFFASVAQLVEQRTRNAQVPGPSPGTGSSVIRKNITTLKSSGMGRVLTVSRDADATFDALVITSGSADIGGGIYNEGTLTVTRCTISNNNASGFGGGIYSMGKLNVDNSTFSANTATGPGGAVFAGESQTNIVNCTFKDNKTTGADSAGGGVCGIGPVVVMNSIFSANSAASNASFYTSSAAYNCIAPAGTYQADNTNNIINSDPKLSSSSIGNGCYPLESGSPAIDKGLPVGEHSGCSVQAYDQRGMVRPQGSGVDIGAYEYYACVVPVDAGAAAKIAAAEAATGNTVNVNFAVAGTNKITSVAVPTSTGSVSCNVMTATIVSANVSMQAVPQTSVPINITPLQQKGILHTVSADNYEPKVDESSMLPVTTTIEVSSADLQTVINKIQKRGGAKLDPAKVKKNPSIYATDLFYVLLLQKQLVDEGTKNKYVTLVPDILSAAEAENMGILTLAPKGDGIVVSLKYYVADAWIDNGATVQDGNLIVGDGCKNGRIVDPVWLNMVGDKDSSSSGTNNCNAGFGALALLAAIPVLFVRKKS
jgi:Synergist-CTERM protein sorting domain-containing protein